MYILLSEIIELGFVFLIEVDLNSYPGYDLGNMVVF
jgi:hypothetical protein